jgi:hypothetical protein
VNGLVGVCQRATVKKNDENVEFEKKECIRNECVSVKRVFLEMGARSLLYSPVSGYEILPSRLLVILCMRRILSQRATGCMAPSVEQCDCICGGLTTGTG